MTRSLSGRAGLTCGDVSIFRGGAHVELQLLLGDVPCHATLIRDGERRERFLEVTTATETLALDFAMEPGTIIRGAEAINADPGWATGRRPVATMLGAFLSWAAGGDFDDRLDFEWGLQATRVIGQAGGMYQAILVPWTIEKLVSGAGALNEDLRYALRELLQVEKIADTSVIDEQIARLTRRFAGADAQHWRRVVTESVDPLAALASLAVSS